MGGDAEPKNLQIVRKEGSVLVAAGSHQGMRGIEGPQSGIDPAFSGSFLAFLSSDSARKGSFPGLIGIVPMVWGIDATRSRDDSALGRVGLTRSGIDAG